MDRVGKLLAKLTMAPATVVALLIAVSFFSDSPGSALGAPAVGLREGQELNLVGARGEEVEFAIKDNSLGGRWASETGIELTLRNESGFQRSFEIAGPEEKDWDDSLTVSSRSDHEFEILASFDVPDVPGPETQMLTGAISGDFEYPDATGDESFSDVSETLDIPVTLELVSPEEAEEIRSPVETQKRLRLLVGIPTILICFAYIIIWASWKDRELVGKRWVIPVLVALGAAVWGLGALSWVNSFFSG